MATKPATLDKWRDYFLSSNSDIFNIIEHAIMVAASDCPQEFRLRRDGIAQTLFSCKLTRCVGCDRIELSVPGRENDGDDDDDDEKGCKTDDGCEFGAGGSKESKVNSSSRDEQVEMKMMNQVSNYSYGEAEALSDEIEEQSQIVGEVLRIKEILDNSQDEPDSELFDSLRRLQLMILSVDTLKATEIGKSVNVLRKHESKEIRHLARTLIEEWKVMVDEWVSATTVVAGTEGTPESVNPSVVDDDDEEEGLPSPPMDEGIFFSTHPSSMDFSDKFFDDMDEDGNIGYSGKSKQSLQNGRKPSLDNQIPPKSNGVANEKSKGGDEMKKEQELIRKKEASAFVKPHKPSNTVSGPGRPTKMNVEHKEASKVQHRPEKSTMQKKPSLVAQQDKPKCSDESARLEAAKRKLQERYQQAENAKKQRTIQVMELHDLPKQGLGNKNLPAKPGNHNRHRLLARR